MYLGFMSGDFSVRLLQFTAHILRKCGFTPEMLMLENDKLYTRFKHAWEHLRYLNPCSIQQWRTFLVKKRKFGHWKCAVLCAINNIKKINWFNESEIFNVRYIILSSNFFSFVLLISLSFSLNFTFRPVGNAYRYGFSSTNRSQQNK